MTDAPLSDAQLRSLSDSFYVHGHSVTKAAKLADCSRRAAYEFAIGSTFKWWRRPAGWRDKWRENARLNKTRRDMEPRLSVEQVRLIRRLNAENDLAHAATVLSMLLERKGIHVTAFEVDKVIKRRRPYDAID